MKIHEAIEPMVFAFRDALEAQLGTTFYGLYLYNSVALGEFEPIGSDVDFIVILKRPLEKTAFVKMAALHENMVKMYSHGHCLDGMYLLFEAIGKGNDSLAPYPYAKDGRFYESGYFDVNNVTWWVLKEHECAVDSPSLRTQLESFSYDRVRQTLAYNIHHYWASKLSSPERFNDDEWVTFTVLTLSRIAYTLQTEKIVSKRKASLDLIEKQPKWRDVVEEALAVRSGQSLTVITDRTTRRDRTYEFAIMMVEDCKLKLESRGR